jgi:hypothetical protein
MPQKPPNKTKTRPGLGEGNFPRMDSAEMKRVRDSFRREEAVPESTESVRPRVRDSVRREDPEPEPRGAREAVREETAGSVRPRLRDSVRREDPEDEPEATTPEPSATESGRPRLRDSVRREDPNDDGTVTPATARSDRPNSRRTASWESEPTTGTRRKSGSPAVRSGRPPVTVDEVGTAAVKLARTSLRDSAPKVIASRTTIAKAPIDTRAAFVLSLVDGRNTVEALVDMAGMPEEEVRGILSRLARLGLISLP